MLTHKEWSNSSLDYILQLLSIDDVEKIMEETQEGIEYQRVSNYKRRVEHGFNLNYNKLLSCFAQEIDELLATNLSQEDEDAVLNELEELAKVLSNSHISIRPIEIID